MTTIIVKRSKAGGWRFGWDSQVTTGSRADPYSLQKVFRNRVVFGVAGSVRVANLIQNAAIPAVKGTPSVWVNNTLVPTLIKVLRENLAIEVEKESVDSGSHFVVEVNGEVFEVGSDFSVIPVRDFCAIGSGSRYASGALFVGAGLKRSLEAAYRFDVYTGFGFTIANVEDVR